MAQTPPPAPAVAAPEIRRSLEGTYLAWRDAMEKRDLAAWEKVTAQSRQVSVRNEIVSQRVPFPAALFEGGLRAPDLRALTFLDAFSRGETASAVYFGKADFGLGDPTEVRENFVVLRFVKEFGIWKFDNLRVVKFGEDSELLAKVSNNDRTFLAAPEFQPDPAPPAVAGTVRPPDYVSEIWITAAGYEAVITVNGQHRSSISNDSGRELVIGGLNKGVNRIKVEVKPAANAGTAGTARHLEIGIYGASGPQAEAKRYYHFRSAAGAEIAGFETAFNVP